MEIPTGNQGPLVPASVWWVPGEPKEAVWSSRLSLEVVEWNDISDTCFRVRAEVHEDDSVF